MDTHYGTATIATVETYPAYRPGDPNRVVLHLIVGDRLAASLSGTPRELRALLAEADQQLATFDEETSAARSCPFCDVPLPDDDDAVNAHYDTAHHDEDPE